MIDFFSPEMLRWSHYISGSLFFLGLFGFLVRRNALVVLMCIELMLNSVNLFLVEISMRSGSPEGILMVVFTITVAAAEAAIGLGIVLRLYRVRGNIEIDSFKGLHG